MGKFVLFYQGGGQPQTPQEQEATLKAWTDWFTSLGAAVVDPGNPFGGGKAISPDGTVGETTAGGTGYSVLQADDLGAAVMLSKSCPHLAAGGTVEVYETFQVM